MCGLQYCLPLASVSVPPVVTRLPWQFSREGGEEIEEGPCDDDIVVKGDEESNHEHSHTDTLEEWHHLPYGDGAFPTELA